MLSVTFETSSLFFLPEVGDKEEQEMLQQAQDLLSSEETTSDSRKETKQLGCQRKTS